MWGSAAAPQADGRIGQGIGERDRPGALQVLVATFLGVPGGDLVEVGLLLGGEARRVVLRGRGDGQEVDPHVRVRLCQAGADAGSEVAAVGGVAVEAELVAHEAVSDLVSLQCGRRRRALG